jgi:hypothetical protein
MMNAHFLICHNQDVDYSVSMHQHVSSGIYSKPGYACPSGNQSILVMTEPLIPILGYATNTSQTCFFKRVLNPLDPYFPKIGGSIDLLWGFSNVDYFSQDTKFDFHGFNWMGKVLANFEDGRMIKQSVLPTLPMKIHGYGMMVIWLFIFPLGAFIARYFRSIPGWYKVKAMNQSAGGAVAVILIVLVYRTTANFKMTTYHNILGWVIFCVMLVQMAFGAANVIGFTSQAFQPFKKSTQTIHKVSGFLLLIVSIFQVGLGINNLYPLERPQNLTIWYIFFFFSVFWVLLFSVAEMYYRVAFKVTDAGYGKLQAKQKTSNTRKSSIVYTWKSLAEATEQGKLLVVANQKYVYDVSNWIDSHPGGRFILYTVAGTDISNDYFHTAGYDASLFTPKARAPKKIKFSSKHSSREASQSNLVKTQEMSPGGVNMANQLEKKLKNLATKFAETPNQDINEEDWSEIKKARKTHVHTRLAIERLSELMIGEMDTGPISHSKMDLDGSTLFDPYEYRRYTLTEIETLSSPGMKTEFAKFRFCLLYPYDKRGGEPSKFLPGQFIEIQVRMRNGQFVTRSYYAQTGNMTALELLIKQVNKDKNKMTGFLFSQDPGKCQFKIRGPFGNELISPPLTMNTPHDRVEDIVYFFAAGSGITPFIQLINYNILPLNTLVPIIKAFKAKKSNELSISIGDAIVIEYHYLNGFAVSILTF